MSTASTVWLIIYGIATLTFFSVAAVITYFGIRDLKDLLSRTNRKNIESNIVGSLKSDDKNSGRK